MGKTKASVTATAKAKSKEAASAKAKAAASIISTALVDASPKCKARCQINRRDIEGQVQRALESCFVDLHVAEVYKLKDTPAELSFHDVERVRGFWWLLSMQQIQQLQEVSKAIIDAGKTATVQNKPQQRVTPSTSSKKAKTAGASSSSAFDINRNDILKFFGK